MWQHEPAAHTERGQARKGRHTVRVRKSICPSESHRQWQTARENRAEQAEGWRAEVGLLDADFILEFFTSWMTENGGTQIPGSERAAAPENSRKAERYQGIPTRGAGKQSRSRRYVECFWDSFPQGACKDLLRAQQEKIRRKIGTDRLLPT